MRLFQLSTAAVLLLFLTVSASAMEVSKVKGNRVLIQLDDQPVSPGEEYYAINPDGKRKGLIQVKQVRDERAIGVLVKGQAEPGWTMEKRTAKGKKSKAQKEAVAADTTGNPNDRAYYGIQLGMSLNQMSVSQDGGPSVSLTGNSINFRGLFDYELFDRIWFRGSVGYMGFKVTGPNQCVPAGSFTSACTVDISYLNMDFWGRYLFAMGMYRPWLGGGFSLIFPLTKSATPLDPSSITNNSIMALGGGLDWFFTKRFYVPLQAEYGLLPRSSSVAASLIVLRLGAAFTF